MANKSETEIREWCIAYLAKSLKRPPDKIDPNAKFSRLGLDSASSVNLLMDLEEYLGAELSSDLVFEYPTIAQLARQIAGHASGSAGGGVD